MNKRDGPDKLQVFRVQSGPVLERRICPGQLPSLPANGPFRTPYREGLAFSETRPPDAGALLAVLLRREMWRRKHRGVALSPTRDQSTRRHLQSQPRRSHGRAACPTAWFCWLEPESQKVVRVFSD